MSRFDHTQGRSIMIAVISSKRSHYPVSAMCNSDSLYQYIESHTPRPTHSAWEIIPWIPLPSTSHDMILVIAVACILRQGLPLRPQHKRTKRVPFSQAQGPGLPSSPTIEQMFWRVAHRADVMRNHRMTLAEAPTQDLLGYGTTEKLGSVVCWKLILVQE